MWGTRLCWSFFAAAEGEEVGGVAVGFFLAYAADGF